jgi:hypothetical protein
MLCRRLLFQATCTAKGTVFGFLQAVLRKVSYQNEKRFQELEAHIGRTGNLSLGNQILQIIQRRWRAVIFEPPEISQGFIFLAAGCTLIQMLL